MTAKLRALQVKITAGPPPKAPAGPREFLEALALQAQIPQGSSSCRHESAGSGSWRHRSGRFRFPAGTSLQAQVPGGTGPAGSGSLQERVCRLRFLEAQVRQVQVSCRHESAGSGSWRHRFGRFRFPAGTSLQAQVSGGTGSAGSGFLQARVCRVRFLEAQVRQVQVSCRQMSCRLQVSAGTGLAGLCRHRLSMALWKQIKHARYLA